MLYFSGYRRHSAGSALGSVLLMFVFLIIEMGTDHGYSTHHSRSTRLAPGAPDAPDAAPAEPHVAGAFYPDDHPEMLSRRAEGHPVSYMPYISAGLGGLAVFMLVGSGAFFVLGMANPEPDAIDLDAPS